MEHPKDVGDRTALAVMFALRDEGYAISLPFGENTRYDLVIDDGVRLLRVQCKSGRLRGGAIHFNAASTYAHHRSSVNSSRNYQGQIDYFGVYCHDTGGVYLIPIGDVPSRSKALLRIDPPRNGQRKRIRPAAAYQIGGLKVTGDVLARPALRATAGAR